MRNVARFSRSKRLRSAYRTRFAFAMKSSSSLPRDCAGIAPQLTALFDGEADETQTQQARAHLLVCPECSRAWLNWTQYRATLQSEPVPAPPPTFLWRLLIAYRVAAFAHPARHRSNLSTFSAHALRDLEAPLPPRLSQHILAQTTRKPSAHVMLTPLIGAPPMPNARQKARAAKFRRFPLMAAPALALWVLMLGRANLVATFPVLPSEATISVTSSDKGSDKPAKESAIPVKFAPVPVLSAPIAERIAPPQFADATRTVLLEESAAAQPTERVLGNIATRIVAAIPRVRRARPSEQSGETFNRALLLAMNAGRTDIARAQSVPAKPIAPIRVAAPIELAPVTQLSSRAEAPMPVRKARKINVRSAARANFVSEPSAGFVSLAALTSPIGPVRTFTAARMRPAVFSEDSAMRPRVAYASADGRRLARLSLNESEISLRVSRPNAGAPTFRASNFAGDNGPRIEDLRSAVDDFRASVSGERAGDE